MELTVNVEVVTSLIVPMLVIAALLELIGMELDV
jgi:hypothetical protein